MCISCIKKDILNAWSIIRGEFMSNNNRFNMAPVPRNLDIILNSLQLITLYEAVNEGWELLFVRREGLNDPVPVIKGSDKKIGIIEKDGNFNGNPEIRIRNKFGLPEIICLVSDN